MAVKRIYTRWGRFFNGFTTYISNSPFIHFVQIPFRLVNIFVLWDGSVVTVSNMVYD